MNKYLKALGLALIAALAITAFAGATSASAKVCSGSGTGEACAGSHGKVFSGTITATSTNAVLVSSWNTVSCKHSHLHGTITNGVTGTGDIETLDFSECTDSFGQKCTASTTASEANKWMANAVTGTAPNGTMTVENVAGSFTCGSTTCNYSTAKAGASGEIVVKGGAPAVVTATKVPLTKGAGSGALCSSTASWSGTYTVSVPSSLYLT
jgi:hypothetical protein